MTNQEERPQMDLGASSPKWVAQMCKLGPISRPFYNLSSRATDGDQLSNVCPCGCHFRLSQDNLCEITKQKKKKNVEWRLIFLFPLGPGKEEGQGTEL